MTRSAADRALEETGPIASGLSAQLVEELNCVQPNLMVTPFPEN